MFRAIFIFFVKIDRKYFLLRSYYIIEAICDMITEKTGKYRHILCMLLLSYNVKLPFYILYYNAKLNFYFKIIYTDVFDKNNLQYHS